jgi:hypothetical protein
LIDKAVVLMANDQAAEGADPGDGAFDFPASAVAAKLSTILCVRAYSAATVWADQVPALGQQAGSQLVAVVGSIGNQRRGLFPGRDLVEDSFDQRDLSRRSTFGPACEWNSLTIRHHQPLCTLSPLRFADSVAPFFAGEKLASTNTSSQSSRPCSSSVSRKACQILTSTPSPSHSTSRRQHVLGDGYRSGKSRQRAPLRSTHRMPSKQARSSDGGRPPFADRLRFGMNGLIRSHCSSVTKTSCRLAIERSPFNSLDNASLDRAQV